MAADDQNRPLNKKATICMMIYSYFPGFTGGAEKQCRLQSQELGRRGYRCIVLTARTMSSLSTYEIDGGCEVVRLGVVQPLVDALLRFKAWISAKRSDRYISIEQHNKRQITENQNTSYSSIVQWLNTAFYLIGASIYLFRHKNEIDILHTHIASWNAGFAGWIGNLLDIPVLCKAAYLPAFHEFGKSIPFSETWHRWRKRIRFIALTWDMAEDIVLNGVPPEKVHVIPNGVLITGDSVSVDSNDCVLCVANFTQGSAHKGFDVLIKAWAKVHRILPNACLRIAGGGDSEPWRTLAKALKCDKGIQFMGHLSDINDCYRRTAIFVLPSREEGISNALLETQSFGIPAVASDIPGNREIIVHQQTGLLVPVGDEDAFAEGIVKLIQDVELRKKMGQAARERITKQFSIASVIDKVCAVYDQMWKQ